VAFYEITFIFLLIAIYSTKSLNYVRNIDEVVVLKLGMEKLYRLEVEVLEILKSRKLTLSVLLLSGLLQLKN
jgi:hypothetical protein